MTAVAPDSRGDEQGLPFVCGRARMPREEMALGARDGKIEQQREGGEDQDAREYAVDVERPLRLQDEIPDAGGRAEVLAHDRAHERHSDADVQTGEDPTGRGGQVDVAEQLPARGAQHAHAGKHHRANYAFAQEDVEEVDEADQRAPVRYFV